MRVPTSTNSQRKQSYVTAEFEATLLRDYPMSAYIAAGAAWINNLFVDFRGSRTPAIIPPVTGIKLDVICLKQDATLTVVLGTPASNNPVIPAIPVAHMPLHIVINKSGTQALTDEMILDARAFFNAYVPAETDLSNYALIEHVDQKDGTTSESFTLNQGYTGVPTNNIGFYVNRGSLGFAGIRFNEIQDYWEYTNDGSLWHPLGNAIIPAATFAASGAVRLSAVPLAGTETSPIVVGDNDPRMVSLANHLALSHASTTIENATKTETSTGSKGDRAYDSTHLYLCVATDTWVRVAIDPWVI